MVVELSPMLIRCPFRNTQRGMFLPPRPWLRRCTPTSETPLLQLHLPWGRALPRLCTVPRLDKGLRLRLLIQFLDTTLRTPSSAPMVPRVIAVNATTKRRGKVTSSAIAKAPNMRERNITVPSMIATSLSREGTNLWNTSKRILNFFFIIINNSASAYHMIHSIPPSFTLDISSG